jgi:hypothetical protein
MNISPLHVTRTSSFAAKAVTAAFHRLLYRFYFSSPNPCGRSAHRDIGLDREKGRDCAGPLSL